VGESERDSSQISEYVWPECVATSLKTAEGHRLMIQRNGEADQDVPH
jgi:hypothetical protein